MGRQTSIALFFATKAQNDKGLEHIFYILKSKPKRRSKKSGQPVAEVRGPNFTAPRLPT